MGENSMPVTEDLSIRHPGENVAEAWSGAERKNPFKMEGFFQNGRVLLFTDMVFLHLTIKRSKTNTQTFRSLGLIAMTILQYPFYMAFFNLAEA